MTMVLRFLKGLRVAVNVCVLLFDLVFRPIGSWSKGWVKADEADTGH